MRHGCKVIGEKRLLTVDQRMTRHLVHNKANRLYWCDCMPSFRLGDGRVSLCKGRPLPRGRQTLWFYGFKFKAMIA